MIHLSLRSLVLVVASFTVASASGCIVLDGLGEGEGEEGEGEAGEGEGEEGEGEGEVGEGEGDGFVGEDRTFACNDSGPIRTIASCTVDADCTTARVGLDCCGTPRDTGVNTASAADFTAAYADCSAGQPVCDCIPATLSADDGSLDDGSLAVTCVEGLCTTSFGEGDRGLVCGLGGEMQTEASCTEDIDCTFTTVQVDCCGALAVTGINTSDGARTLPTTAAQCAEGFPDCDCAATSTIADDGTTSLSLAAEPTVTCAANICTTSFGP